MAASTYHLAFSYLFCYQIELVGLRHKRCYTFCLRATDVVEIHSYRRPALTTVGARNIFLSIGKVSALLSSSGVIQLLLGSVGCIILSPILFETLAIVNLVLATAILANTAAPQLATRRAERSESLLWCFFAAVSTDHAVTE